MKKNDLLKIISNSPEEQESIKKKSKTDTIKIIIFEVNNNKFAILASLVKEIYETDFIHPLPFVPIYVRGLINKQGEPYTVVDLQLLFNQEKIESSMFLVINKEKDHMAYMIHDVIDIIKIDKSGIYEIIEDSGLTFFDKYIDIKNEKIYLLNIDHISRKLKSDVDNA